MHDDFAVVLEAREVRREAGGSWWAMDRMGECKGEGARYENDTEGAQMGGEGEMTPQPKLKRKKPAYSDGYLMKLWRQAVRKQKGDRCLNCGAPATGTHHIIKRRFRVLRYDVLNGVPLCSVCHPIADRSQQFALELVSREDRDYLAQMGVYTLPEWLSINRMTHDEFLKAEAEGLKELLR